MVILFHNHQIRNVRPLSRTALNIKLWFTLLMTLRPLDLSAITVIQVHKAKLNKKRVEINLGLKLKSLAILLNKTRIKVTLTTIKELKSKKT